MHLEIYQYIVPLICGVFLIRIGIQYKGRRRSVLSTVVWSVFWVVVAILAFAPHLLSTFLAEVLGFRDNVHAVLFLGLGLALLIVFYLSSVIDKLETQLTELVRMLALKDAEKLRTKQEEEKEVLEHQEKKS